MVNGLKMGATRGALGALRRRESEVATDGADDHSEHHRLGRGRDEIAELDGRERVRLARRVAHRLVHGVRFAPEDA